MNKYVKHFRGLVLAAIVIMVSVAAYLHQVNGGGKSPSIHALCPFGGLESLYQFFSSGTFISKIFSGTLVLFVITLILAIAFRRSFCGLICPFGAIQEFFAKVGNKLMGKILIMPAKVDRPLRYLKYVILAVTVFYAWKTAGLWMSPYDPWSAYAHLFTNNPLKAISDTADESLIGLILLAITLIGSFLYNRFFCKYLCPVGALYGIIGKISPMKIERDEDICIDCNKCNKACPVNIDVANIKEVRDIECIDCQLCVSSCPKAGALQTRFGTKRLKPAISISLILFLFFGAIFAADISGIYQVTPLELAEGETIKLDEVKGYMSIDEAAIAVGMDIDQFYAAYKIPDSVGKETKMKEIKDIIPEYDFDAIKDEVETEKVFDDSTIPLSTIKIDVSAIRGSMSIKEAAPSLHMDLKDFYVLFKIPDNVPEDTALKDITNLIPNYDFHQIKESLTK